MTNTVMALQEFQDETVELPALLYNFCTGTSVVTYNLKTKKRKSLQGTPRGSCGLYRADVEYGKKQNKKTTV